MKNSLIFIFDDRKIKEVLYIKENVMLMGRLILKNIKGKNKKYLEGSIKNSERNRILINGSLISIGLVAILDNIISHWIFKWHSILPDQTLSKYLEIASFILGLILLGIGTYRERKDRRIKYQ
jgi:hypothetical protein